MRTQRPPVGKTLFSIVIFKSYKRKIRENRTNCKYASVTGVLKTKKRVFAYNIKEKEDRTKNKIK